MSDHQLTRYESLVRETPVFPASHGAGLTATGESVVEDYSDESGSSWIACRCGAQFQSEEAAVDHLVDAYGVTLRAKAYSAIRRVQDLAENADNQRVVEEMEQLALTVEENTNLASRFNDACREFAAQFVTDDAENDPAEELICIVDTSRPEGRDMVSGYDAEVVHGLVVVREVYDENARCEHCQKQGAYCLKNTVHGAGLCREHLAEDPSFAGVVEEGEAVREFELPEAPVNGGEDR